MNASSTLNTPVFAVVGHPNKGKSSIVATLAESERIAIADLPGTTTRADRYSLSLAGREHYALVDTPGFQRAGAVLAWLTATQSAAHERSQAVADFVRVHAQDPDFADECELLRPILDGAGILYVVDGSKPFGAEFEIEMEILRWTGRPRMALINMIGEDDYQQEWLQGLGQFFSIVRVFDAMRARYEARLALLGAFGELEEAWRTPLSDAVTALRAERARRMRFAAQDIADALFDALTHAERASIDEREERSHLADTLTAKLQSRLRRRERKARDAVQGHYRHADLDRHEVDVGLSELDLFTEEGWELFGLSKQQLVLSGAVSGAVAGFGIDALIGGASLMLGSGVGALIGGVTTWLGSSELAKIEILGSPLGGEVIQVGPVRAPNFAWVWLGRAWVHHHLVSERNHALREKISATVQNNEHLMDGLPQELRRDLGKVFAEIRGGSTGARERLRELVLRVLECEPVDEGVGG